MFTKCAFLQPTIQPTPNYKGKNHWYTVNNKNKYNLWKLSPYENWCCIPRAAINYYLLILRLSSLWCSLHRHELRRAATCYGSRCWRRRSTSLYDLTPLSQLENLQIKHSFLWGRLRNTCFIFFHLSDQSGNKQSAAYNFPGLNGYCWHPIGYSIWHGQSYQDVIRKERKLNMIGWVLNTAMYIIYNRTKLTSWLVKSLVTILCTRKQ